MRLELALQLLNEETYAFTTLDIPYEFITLQHAKKLATAIEKHKGTGCKVVNLSNCCLSNDSLTLLLTALKKHTQLTTLNLGGNELTDACQHALASLTHFKSLSTLNLSRNPGIGETIGKTVLELVQPHCPLANVDIAGTAISEQTRVNIKTAIQLPKTCHMPSPDAPAALSHTQPPSTQLSPTASRELELPRNGFHAHAQHSSELPPSAGPAPDEETMQALADLSELAELMVANSSHALSDDEDSLSTNDDGMDELRKVLFPEEDSSSASTAPVPASRNVPETTNSVTAFFRHTLSSMFTSTSPTSERLTRSCSTPTAELPASTISSHQPASETATGPTGRSRTRSAIESVYGVAQATELHICQQHLRAFIAKTSEHTTEEIDRANKMLLALSNKHDITDYCRYILSEVNKLESEVNKLEIDFNFKLLSNLKDCLGTILQAILKQQEVPTTYIIKVLNICLSEHKKSENSGFTLSKIFTPAEPVETFVKETLRYFREHPKLRFSECASHLKSHYDAAIQTSTLGPNHPVIASLKHLQQYMEAKADATTYINPPSAIQQHSVRW